MNLTDRVVAYFLLHPDTEIDGRVCAAKFGWGGFRTRISEARRHFGMNITVRVADVKSHGRVVRRSWYRFTPRKKAA